MTEPTALAVDLLRRLVAFDTTSDRPNRPLIGYVRDFLAHYGIAARVIPDSTGDKANLLATVGPSGQPGIVLSGHTDVVPVAGQTWTSDPFTVTERDGRYYGRGTADMKGFLACILALAPELAARPPAIPVHFALSYDEEVGCRGAPDLVAAAGDLSPPPALVVVGEPTDMRVIHAHKGKHAGTCTVTGRESHSALPHHGINAVEIAGELVAGMAEAARSRAEGPLDDGFDPPYTTVHTGTIAGGTAVNIVPRSCTFGWEVRALPSDDPDAALAPVRRELSGRLEARMRAVAPETGIAWTDSIRFPGLAEPADSPAVRRVLAAAGETAAGKVSFGTEAGLYREAGMPAVVCGPGSITQAHKPDEFVSTRQLAACEGFLRALIEAG